MSRYRQDQNRAIRDLLLSLDEILALIPEDKSNDVIQKAERLIDLLPNDVRKELDGRLGKIKIIKERPKQGQSEKEKKRWVRITCPSCGSYNVSTTKMSAGVDISLEQAEYKCFDCRNVWRPLKPSQSQPRLQSEPKHVSEAQRTVESIRQELLENKVADISKEDTQAKVEEASMEAGLVSERKVAQDAHKPVQEEVGERAKPMIRCPMCSTELEINVKSCSFCNTSLLPDQCPSCLKVLQEGFRFCPYCTVRLDRCKVCNRYIESEQVCKYCVAA